MDIDLIPEDRRWDIYQIVVNAMIKDDYINLEKVNEMTDAILKNYYDYVK